MLRTGQAVQIRDGNGHLVSGTVHSRSGANDGTGRHGYLVSVQGDLYWRPRSGIRARRAADPSRM